MGAKHLILNFAKAAIALTESGAAFDVGGYQDLIAEARCGVKTGGTSLTVVLEDSFDGGVTWNSWIAFTAWTASSGIEVKAPTRPPGPLVRYTATEVGGGSWANVTIRLAGNLIAG